MTIVQKFECYPGSKEEKLPNFSKTFPYVTSRAELALCRQACPLALALGVRTFFTLKVAH